MTAPLLVGLGVFCLALIGAGMWLLRALARQELRDRRIALVREGAGQPPVAASAIQGGLALRVVGGLGQVLARSGLLPAATLSGLEATLAAAGLRQRNALAVFIGAKLLLLPIVPLLAWLALRGISVSPSLRPVLLGASGIVGLLLPDFFVRRMRQTYLKEVGRGLPDALDMLVICSEAGLGLEVGLERVADEIQPAHPAVAAELKTTSAELRVLADRRVALTNMGTRTGLDTLKRLGGTLIQTMQYGTPLSQALRTLATEMRFEMLMKFEAQAARLPVLLTVPMILFILPCIFIVVGGPAGLTVMRTFMHK